MPVLLPEDSLKSPHAQQSLSRIADLIEALKEAAAASKAQGRGETHPYGYFNLEEPMAWVRLWNLDTPRYYSDPLFYVETTLRQKLWRWETFPDDGMPLSAEIPASLSMYPEYTFLGMQVYFSEEGIPTIQTDHPMTRDPDLSLLRPVDYQTSGWMPRILRWWEAINRIVDGRIGVTNAMFWWRGPLDLGMQLRSYENLMLDIAERPGFVHDLFKFLTEQRCRWWEAHDAYFDLPRKPADIGEDWLNVPFISPKFFRDFVLPRYKELEAFHGSVSNVHSCGDQAPLQKYLLELTSMRQFEVSPWTSLEKSLENLPADRRLVIGLHPNDVLFASPDEMEARLRHIQDACSGRQYDIYTSGLTPILETHQAFVRQVNLWTRIVKRVFGSPLQADR